ncbi:uncharacterized protein MELLADRAFT_74050 [Melampsora larici-populina 98AG31]|uniref:50S ribosomal protein L35 n=1 Tax=Melampsora larici-populina (strain 98AG31 / pathotype 3-4-7) TaxID=747676 RepID=F4R7X3_MELLP|nr:uncharacterized protein MELLADRAFT_74050 [Melampsora larici-populina 98AG31]EGG11394.1 hypothetical protein MELLADRAFT_74050 [Melampsora larici-populina 98AG31]
MSISMLTSLTHRSTQSRLSSRLYHQFSLPRLNITITPLRLFSSSIPSNWKSSKPKNKPNRYKLKTHQGASKRFFVTGHGQFKRSQAGKQHLMTGTSHSKKRKLKPMIIVNKTHTTKLRKLLPYVGKRAGFRKVNEVDSVWWSTGRLQKSGSALRLAILRAKGFEKLKISGSTQSDSISNSI